MGRRLAPSYGPRGRFFFSVRILYEAVTDGVHDKLLTSADDTREEQQRREATEEQQRGRARGAYNGQRERRPEVPTANRFDALTMEEDED